VFRLILSTLVLAALISVGKIAYAAQDDARWIVMADIHFDPFADRTIVDRLAGASASEWPAILSTDERHVPAGAGHDSDAALLASALLAMKRAVPDPPVVLIAGDFLAHRFRERFDATARIHDDDAYRSFVEKTTDYLALVLHRTYPHAQILPTIGNNDGVCGDYRSAQDEDFLAHMARTWEPLVNVGNRAPDFAHTFAWNGSYVARLPLNHSQIIVLNSVFWSAKYENACGSAQETPGDDELRWAARLLDHPPVAERTWVMTHIPPGIDEYSTLMLLGHPISLYRADAQQRLLTILDNPRAHVTTMIAGHLHQFAFRQSNAEHEENVPILVAGSISPVYGNAPSFLAIQIAPETMRIADFTSYSFGASNVGPPVWRKDYDFNATYDENGFTPASLADLHRRELTTSGLRTKIAQHAAASDMPLATINPGIWRASWCAQTELTPQTFTNCMQIMQH
jgi:sphingomyelin phosphodiesterase acid-like 3